MNYYNF